MLLETYIHIKTNKQVKAKSTTYYDFLEENKWNIPLEKADIFKMRKGFVVYSDDGFIQFIPKESFFSIYKKAILLTD